MADNTRVFLEQIAAILAAGFTGELSLQCRDGMAHHLDVRQRIRSGHGDQTIVLAQATSAMADVGARRPECYTP